MRQDLIDENKDLIDEIVGIIAITFSENVPMYVARKEGVKKASPVAMNEKEKIHRYGVFLTQSGENLVYTQLLRLQDCFRKKYKFDKYDSMTNAKDIMCIYILKEAFRIAKIPFNSNYSAQLKSKQRTFSIKMFGFIMFAIMLIIVLVVFIASLF